MNAAKNEKEPKTLAEKAYDLIKNKLIQAEYVPGQFMQESQIAGDLGLGRTPVHSALHRLHQEGLVDIIPRKGIMVQADSLSEIFLALETRKLIEPHCAARGAERRTVEQIEELEQICVEMEDDSEPSDQRRLMEIDRRFHARIAQSAGNHLLSDFLSSVHDRMSRIWFLPSWRFHDFDLTASEHRAILQGIADRDPTAAAAAMKAHLDSLHRRIMAASPS